ncbi:MAG: hypothetical protein IJT73_00540 [Selenomonadaceae bacterium]|nr:hypothetical protein [Selenomonadaceae bacterium]
MKKMFVAVFAVMVFAVMSGLSVSTENAAEIDSHNHLIHSHAIHNHASAAGYNDIRWQCNKCGMQANYTGSSYHPSEYGCDASRNSMHSWSKIYAGGSRPVNWQCVKCGITTWISSFPNEFGCNNGRRHIWQRLD